MWLLQSVTLLTFDIWVIQNWKIWNPNVNWSGWNWEKQKNNIVGRSLCNFNFWKEKLKLILFHVVFACWLVVLPIIVIIRLFIFFYCNVIKFQELKEEMKKSAVERDILKSHNTWNQKERETMKDDPHRLLLAVGRNQNCIKRILWQL